MHIDTSESEQVFIPESDLPSEESIASDLWWAMLAEIQTPIVRGARTIFLFRSTLPVVFFDLNGITDHHHDPLCRMHRHGASDLHSIVFELDDDFCGTYSFFPCDAETAAGIDNWTGDSRARFRHLAEHITGDPLSRLPAVENPWGTVSQYRGPAALAVFTTAAFAGGPASSAGYGEGPRADKTLVWDSELLTFSREVQLFSFGIEAGSQQGADGDGGSGHREKVREADVPLVILLDGEQWTDGYQMMSAIAAGVESGQYGPMHVLTVPNGGLERRYREYGASEDFAEAMIQELLPLTAAALGDVSPSAKVDTASDGTRKPQRLLSRRVIVAGQSMGGLTAAYLLMTRAEHFDGAVCQSASFWWPDRGAALRDMDGRGYEPWLAGYVGAGQGRPLWISIGTREGAMLEYSRIMKDVCLNAGYDLSYREFNGGHDVVCWADDLLLALERLVPPTTPGQRL